MVKQFDWIIYGEETYYYLEQLLTYYVTGYVIAIFESICPNFKRHTSLAEAEQSLQGPEVASPHVAVPLTFAMGPGKAFVLQPTHPMSNFSPQKCEGCALRFQ